MSRKSLTMSLWITTALGALMLIGTTAILLLEVRAPAILQNRVRIGGPFELVDQNGQAVTDKDLAGRPTLLCFGYSHCPDTCPTLSELSGLIQKLGPQADTLNAVFVTVDPERGTRQVLATYGRAFDPHIRGQRLRNEHTAAVYLLTARASWLDRLTLRRARRRRLPKSSSFRRPDRDAQPDLRGFRGAAIGNLTGRQVSGRAKEDQMPHLPRRFVLQAIFAFLGMAAGSVPSARAQGGMMGRGMMDGMMGGMMGPMRTGMALFQHHRKIRRRVTEIPGGIRAITESDDPEVAALIQEHVTSMYARVDQDRPFAYPMSRTVPVLFHNTGRYTRRLDLTPKGVTVTETAEDPDMVELIRAHAREISGFVAEGMPAMMQ